jgi:DNA primase
VRLSSSQRDLLETSANRYNRTLWRVEDYLVERGLSLELADGELLGYVEDPLPGQDQFRGRLSIPYVTRNGVVNLKFRALEGEEPKYLNFPGMETNLFHVESFFKADGFICITEGELDALSLLAADLPAVGVPGVTSWKNHYRRCFEDFSVVYGFCDGDEPGRDFGKFLAREIQARPIYMPQGEDVNSMLVKEGVEWLRSRIDPSSR